MSRVQLERTSAGLSLSLDGRERVCFDDLTITVWGERHRLWGDGLLWGQTTVAADSDEVGTYDRCEWTLGTRSLRQPSSFRLVARCYHDEPVVLLELLPGVSQPVFGQEEAGSLRLSALPDCRESVFIHQRVTEFGRDAVGAWWSQARFSPDPTRDNPFDWGLFSGWRYADGQCAALLPMLAGGASSRLRGDEGGLSLVASGFCGQHAYPRLPLGLLAFGPEPQAVLDQAFAAACALNEWRFRLRADKLYPAVFEELGWTTWGAFGTQPEEERVADALLSLTAAGIPLRWLLLDEGWQMVDRYARLTGFGADFDRYPSGLFYLLQRLQGHASLRHVGAWVAMHGGWGGVDPHASFAANHPERFMRGTDGTTVPSPQPAGRAFYDAWFGDLSMAGLDFIKVDNQGSVRNLYLGQLPLAEAVGNSVGHVENSANGAGLDLQAGMAHQLECLFNYATTNVIRVSADLVPRDKQAVKQHLAHSVAVGAWLSRIAWPDYDALPSAHGAARALAVMTALSGGPVCLCDAQDTHDADLATRLCLADGRLLLPEAPGQPPNASFFADPLRQPVPLLSLAPAARVPRTPDGSSYADAYPPPEAMFLGAANVRLDGQPLTVTVTPRLLELPEADAYAVNLHFADERYVVAADEPITFNLDELQGELVTLVPLRSGRALIGLPHKLLGACGCYWDDDDLVSLPESGTVLLYDPTELVPRAMDGREYPVMGKPCPLEPGQAWRVGPWLQVNADSTLFQLRPAGWGPPAPPPDPTPPAPPEPVEPSESDAPATPATESATSPTAS